MFAPTILFVLLNQISMYLPKRELLSFRVVFAFPIAWNGQKNTLHYMIVMYIFLLLFYTLHYMIVMYIFLLLFYMFFYTSCIFYFVATPFSSSMQSWPV